MDQIPLFNLRRQYQPLKKELLGKTKEILETTQFTHGQETLNFQEAYAAICQTKYALGVRSGTASLIIALKAVGIGPGDEVITTPVSFAASADCITLVGAKPVFVDVAASTGNLDPNLLESALTSQTKAVLIVHLYGVPCEMNPILAFTKKHKLALIEDASHAHGSEYKGKKVGSFGLAGCFSLYPSKTLGCAGNAGVITSNNKKYIQQAEMYAHHGIKPGGDKYTHFVAGYNELIDNFQAAVLNTKLGLLTSWIQRKQEIARRYNQAFQRHNLQGMSWPDHTNPSFYVYAIQMPHRQKFRKFMEVRGIETGIYYPTPLHLQPSTAHLGYKEGDFPQAELFMHQTISLPLYPELKEIEIKHICQAIHDYLA